MGLVVADSNVREYQSTGSIRDIHNAIKDLWRLPVLCCSVELYKFCVSLQDKLPLNHRAGKWNRTMAGDIIQELQSLGNVEQALTSRIWRNHKHDYPIFMIFI